MVGCRWRATSRQNYLFPASSYYIMAMIICRICRLQTCTVACSKARWRRCLQGAKEGESSSRADWLQIILASIALVSQAAVSPRLYQEDSSASCSFRVVSLSSLLYWAISAPDSSAEPPNGAYFYCNHRKGQLRPCVERW